MDGTKGPRKRSGSECASYSSLGTSGHWGPGMRDNEQEIDREAVNDMGTWAVGYRTVTNENANLSQESIVCRQV